ncbi:hypothetical protein ABBQ38_002739 [Trebouxia sp. C0009 RCD-2024]
MPTAAEIALQRKYADMRAKKQQQTEATKLASSQPVKRPEGPVKVIVKSKHLQPFQNRKQVLPAAKQAKAAIKQALPAVKQGPKITLRTQSSKSAKSAKEQKTTVPAQPPSGPTAHKAPLPSSNPQAAALEAAKRALAARQAAIDKSKAAQGSAPKRPSFRRPTAKRPAAAAPAEEQAAAQAPKKPRLDSLFQQSTAQPSTNGNISGSDIHKVWSPTQHTDLPYSPGAGGSAWSPSAAHQPPQHSKQGYSPDPAGFGQAAGQGYSYTGEGQPGADPSSNHQADQAERTVFVGNVPDEVTDMELAEFFCELGQVLSAQIRGTDGAHYGFVEFAYPEHVQHVLGIADQQPFMMGDCYLRVQPRRAKEVYQGQDEPSEFEYERQELPRERAARIQAEVAAAAAAAVDELDPEELLNIASAPPPDRELMVYDDI